MKLCKKLKRLISQDICGFEACDRKVSMKELKKPEDTDVRVLVEKGKNDNFKHFDA